MQQDLAHFIFTAGQHHVLSSSPWAGSEWSRPQWALLNLYFHISLLWLVNKEHFPLFLPLSEAMPNKPTYRTQITAAFLLYTTPFDTSSDHLECFPESSTKSRTLKYPSKKAKKMKCESHVIIIYYQIIHSPGLWDMDRRIWKAFLKEPILQRSGIFKELLHNLLTVNFCRGNRQCMEKLL